MTRALAVVALVGAVTQVCEFGASSDGRFCCPAWCGNTCGGSDGDCAITVLEEVGKHACGDFAPPCLISSSESEAALDEARAMQDIQRALPDVPRKEIEATMPDVVGPENSVELPKDLAEVDTEVPAGPATHLADTPSADAPEVMAAAEAQAESQDALEAAPVQPDAPQADVSAAPGTTAAPPAPPATTVVKAPVAAVSNATNGTATISVKKPVLDLSKSAVQAAAPGNLAPHAASVGEFVKAFALSGHASTSVRLELPTDPDGDAAVQAEARRSIAIELETLRDQAGERLIESRQHLYAAERARDNATQAFENAVLVAAPGGDGNTLVDARNLSTPPLFAKLLPDFAAVQASTAAIVTSEHEWESRGASGLAHETGQAVRHTLRSAESAALDKRRLVLALKDMDAKVDKVSKIAQQVKAKSHLDDVDPGLLSDLEKLRGVVLVEEGNSSAARTQAAPDVSPLRAAVIAAETRYRLNARTVAAAELEYRTWSAAAASAAAVDAAAENATSAKLQAAIDAQPVRAWGERQLEAAAGGWSRAAAGGARVAQKEQAILTRQRARVHAAADVAVRTNKTLSQAAKVGHRALEDAQDTLADAMAEYKKETDVGAISSVQAFNKSWHALARAVGVTKVRLQTLEEGKRQLNEGATQLRNVATPLASAFATAVTANKVFAAASKDLEKSVQSLELQEADGAADRVARAAQQAKKTKALRGAL